MKIIKSTKPNIELILKTLSNQGLVIMPTETLYGMFADATSETAINKLSAYKKRPFGKPYSVAVSDIKMAEKYVTLNPSAKKIYHRFLPGPVTVISKGKGLVAPGVESENGTLGIRIPDYKLILTIAKKFEKPITATSANASYQKRPYKISDILDNVSNKQKSLIDLIVDAGELPHNEPSTVIDTTSDDSPVLRQGSVRFKKQDKITSTSEQGTMDFAKELYQKYGGQRGQRPILFALEGEMGTGKTIFTKGLGLTLEIDEPVKSPTYDLELEYANKNGVRLLHIDAWRIQNHSEIKDLNILNFINPNSVIAIEWADRIADSIRKFDEDAIVVWVKFEYGKKINHRYISWEVI